MSGETPADIDTRSSVMAEAAKLFATRGYDAVSVREIVQAAGVTKPALYYHFGSKEGVARALLEDFFVAADETRARVFKTTCGLRELFEVYTREMLDLAQRFRTTLAFGFSLWFGRSSLKALIQQAEDYDCKVVKEWAEILPQRGISEGNAVRTVKVYWALLMQELMKVVQCPEWSGCADSMAEEVATLVLNGVSAFEED